MVSEFSEATPHAGRWNGFWFFTGLTNISANILAPAFPIPHWSCQVFSILLKCHGGHHFHLLDLNFLGLSFLPDQVPPPLDAWFHPIIFPSSPHQLCLVFSYTFCVSLSPIMPRSSLSDKSAFPSWICMCQVLCLEWSSLPHAPGNPYQALGIA